ILDTPSVPPLAGQTTTTPSTGISVPSLTPPASTPGGTVVPVALNEVPRNGRIEGGRVNVRAGPNTQYESIAVLGSGAPVTVLAKHGDWYKIVFPADQLASIHKSNVTADITGEIPESGLPGVVNMDNANVHAFYWDKSTVVGHLNQGDPVVIKQERGQWYRIDPPENARAYVFAQYVRVDGQVVADVAPAPVNESVDLAAGTGAPGEVKLSKADQQVNAIKEAYFKRLQEAYEAEREAEERETEQRIRELTERQKAQANQLENALADLDSRLAAIDEETTERITYVTREFQPTIVTGVGGATWAPPDPIGGGYTGWIENIGRVGGAPSTFRLTKGGEIRFFLRSERINLNEYTNRRVWLNGAVEPAGGASASVLNVDQIRILTELEIAEGMRQTAGQPYQPAPTYADPYTASAVQATTYMDPYAATVTQPGGDYDPYAPGGMYAAPQSVGTADLIIPVAAGTVISSQPSGVMTGAPGSVISSVPVYADGGVYTDASSLPSQISPAPTPGAPMGMNQPSTGPTPSDPSQLPDVVGAGTYYVGSVGVDSSIQASPGEVESDTYDNPVIQEIAP
ncbi:MAG: SH3 domain-containing protein, partial [Planctomycetaceae bacterium]|nr:SH3 domain-containing protein [Planctomycetaceae bacterium]